MAASPQEVAELSHVLHLPGKSTETLVHADTGGKESKTACMYF